MYPDLNKCASCVKAGRIPRWGWLMSCGAPECNYESIEEMIPPVVATAVSCSQLPSKHRKGKKRK